MKTRLFLIGVFYALCFNFNAQNNLFGSVKDDSGNPILGVNIYLEGSTYGTVSDFNGNFILSNLNFVTTSLNFEIPGYYITKKEVKASEFNTPIEVTLYTNTKNLEEVQVVSTRAIESSTSVSIMTWFMSLSSQTLAL